MDIKELIHITMYGVEELDDWCEKIYQDNFGEYFKGVKKLRSQMELAERNPISDADLEMVLIDLPLELFSALEQVHRMRTHQELMKVNAKYGAIENTPLGGEDRKVMLVVMLKMLIPYQKPIKKVKKRNLCLNI